MKIRSISGMVILGALIAFLALLLIKRADDIHSLNYTTGLSKLRAAYDSIRNLEDKINEDGEYPEFYSGSYVNENWHVVVCLTDDSDEKKAFFRKYLPGQNVVYKKVNYSYNALLDCKKLIEQDYGGKIRSVFVDVVGNKLIVYVEKYDRNMIDYMSRDIKADMVDFTETDYAAKPPAGVSLLDQALSEQPLPTVKFCLSQRSGKFMTRLFRQVLLKDSSAGDRIETLNKFPNLTF